jgi:hypothetical protein
MIDWALPLSALRTIPVPWQYHGEIFFFIGSAFFSQYTRSPALDRKGGLYPEGKGCVWVVNLVTEAKSYSWVSSKCPELICQA